MDSIINSGLKARSPRFRNPCPRSQLSPDLPLSSSLSVSLHPLAIDYALPCRCLCATHSPTAGPARTGAGSWGSRGSFQWRGAQHRGWCPCCFVGKMGGSTVVGSPPSGEKKQKQPQGNLTIRVGDNVPHDPVPRDHSLRLRVCELPYVGDTEVENV